MNLTLRCLLPRSWFEIDKKDASVSEALLIASTQRSAPCHTGRVSKRSGQLILSQPFFLVQENAGNGDPVLLFAKRWGGQPDFLVLSKETGNGP